MKSFELLARIALTLSKTDDFASQLNAILAITGRFTKVSRTYIFADADDGTTTSNEFEWCNVGIAPQIDSLKNIPHSMLPSWKAMLEQEGIVCAEDIHELPEDLISALEPQGILSLVAYPLYIGGKVRGAIGFDDCVRRHPWDEGELNLLKTISGIVSTVYERKLYQERLERSERNLRTFFDTVDDLVIIADTDAKIIHTNPAVARKLGYPAQQLIGMPIPELCALDHRTEVASVIHEMASGTRSQVALAILRRDGSSIPVDTRGWLGSWDGKTCLISVSKDLSKEQEALQKFTRLFEKNPALMAISSLPKRAFVDVNAAFLRTLGYTRQEVLGKTAPELELFVRPDILASVADVLIATGHVENVEMQLRCKDGTLLDGLFSGEIIATQGKRYLLTVMVDITEQKQLQTRLAKERERLSNIIEGTQLGTWEWNIVTGETTFNERWAEIVGYTLAELEPISIETWVKLAHPEDLVHSTAQLQRHFRKEIPYYQIESRMRHKDGHWIWVQDRGQVIEWDPEGKPIMMFGTHTDITVTKTLSEQIRELSIRDPLTNVYIRRHVLERLATHVEEHHRSKDCFSVTLLDVDYFKRLNDTHGHLAGDHALKELTGLMSRTLRPYDLLARYGGEEFLVVSLHATREQAKSAIERSRRLLAEHRMSFNGAEFSLSFSAGIADCNEFGPDMLSVSSLIERADQRLYLAKERGRNCVLIED
jgi:diguanylate cyclase (GGDEF)-like protein/PAS domain S-box-containing protein